jgi:ribonuclease BN (tRNA processing enzyme)
VRVTVLGKSPSWPDAGGACSGYLVDEGGTALLLDCGNGVFAKLRERLPYAEVDALVISHLHADHFLDLIPFSYALSYGPGAAGARPALHVPPGAREGLRRIVGTWGSEELVENAFVLREYDPDEVRGAATGGRFTFGADTGPSDDLVAFARDTELLMLESTIAEPDEAPRGHLTPAEAGDHAARAGAKRLVLTHLTDEADPDRALREARRAYDGPLEVAVEGAEYEL